MTVLRNNFSAGPDGTKMTIANSGANDDDAFDTMNNGSSPTICAFYDAAVLGRSTAEFVLKVSTGSTVFAPEAIWTSASLGVQTQIYTRVYIMFPVLPTSTTSPIVFFQALTGGGSAFCSYIGLDKSTYQIYMTDKFDPGVGFKVQTSGAITAGQWFRIEARQQYSTTTGNAELRWFNDPDTDVPTETLSFTNQNLGGANTDTWTFGYGWSKANWQAMYMSGLELNNTDWPGPAPFRPGKGIPGILTNQTAIHTDVW